MKKVFVIILLFVFSTAIATADTIILPLENHILKYNSVASILGAKKIDTDTKMIENDTPVYYVGSCLVSLLVDEDGVLTNAGVYKLKGSDLNDFLMSCMTVVTYLGNMDYEAYGHLLFQYSEMLNGKDNALMWNVGNDRFEMMKKGNGDFIFLYYNYDLDCWI